jgi:CRP/FNR family transcriptional regulator, cyclic AMP receptor protein
MRERRLNTNSYPGLKRLSIFEGLSTEEVDRIAGVLHERKFSPGEMMMKEGDLPSSCMVIVSGVVGVYKKFAGGEEEHLVDLHRGDMVGHFGLIDGQRRSATCCAKATEVCALELSRDDFETLFQAETPFAYKLVERIAMDLVERLRQITRKLRDLSNDPTLRQRRKTLQNMSELVGGMDVSALEEDDYDLDNIEFVGTGPHRIIRKD